MMNISLDEMITSTVQSAVENILSQHVSKIITVVHTDERILSSQEVAEMFRANIQTIEKWRREGKGPKFFYDPKGAPNYLLSDVIDYAKDNRVTSTAEFKEKRRIAEKRKLKFAGNI